MIISFNQIKTAYCFKYVAAAAAVASSLNFFFILFIYMPISMYVQKKPFKRN